MEDDGRVVKIAEKFDTEAVEKCVRNQKRSVDADCLASCRCVSTVDGGRG